MKASFAISITSECIFSRSYSVVLNVSCLLLNRDLLNATMSDICPNETQHWFKRWKVPECSLYVGQKLAALPTYVNYDCDIYMHDVQKGNEYKLQMSSRQ